MTLQRKDKHIDATTTDGVNHAVLIGDAATPFSSKIPLHGFGLTLACKRMLLNVLQQLRDMLHGGIIACLLPVVTVFLGLLKQNYLHRSSMAMGWKLPSAMSFSPWRTMSSSSAIDIISASLACFCSAIRLSERTAFFHQALIARYGLEGSKQFGIELHLYCCHICCYKMITAAKVDKKIETAK